MTVAQSVSRWRVRLGRLTNRLLGRNVAGLVGDGAWSFGGKAFSQFVQLTTFVIAARMLAPAEFGFFAFASAIAVIHVVLAEGGWREYVLKARNCEVQLNRVATMSILSAVLFTLVCLVLASWFYSRPDYRWEGVLIAAFSLWIVPAALSAIYEGVLVSSDRLRMQIRLMIAAETVGLAVTVTGFGFGWNALSLVAGRLAMQLAHLCGAVVVTRWIPRPAFERTFTRELLEFSRHILLVRLMVRVRGYAGTLALGSFMGLTEAGLFRAAERIVAALSELVGEPARMLAWVIFRQASSRQKEGDRGVVARSAAAYVAVVLTLAAPLYIGLALVSEPLVRLTLGERWLAAADIVSIMCLSQLFLVPSFVTEPLLSVSGTVRKLPPISFLNAFVMVGTMAIFAPFGLTMAAIGQMIASVFTFGTTLYLQSRHGSMNWGQVLRNIGGSVIAAAALAAAAAWLGTVATSLELRPVVAIAVQAAGGATAYLLALMVSIYFGVSTPLLMSGNQRGDAVPNG